MSSTLPSVNCPNCGAFSSTYDNCEFCGSSLANVVSKELLEAERARKKQLAEEIERRKKEEEEQKRQIEESEKARQQAATQQAANKKQQKTWLYIGTIVAVLVGVFLLIHQCTQNATTTAARSSTHDYGVIINGVRWATRNVDAPGTFAATPECAGRFYQWNRRHGWSATSGNASGWDDSMPTGTMWTNTNNPCPPGWRLPTAAEFQSLDNAGSRWTTQNGVSGRLFGSGSNQLFLPAVGWRVSSSGALNGIGSGGVYWSNTLYHNENTHAMRFGIYQPYTNLEARNHAHGFSVRCVAEGATIAVSAPQQETVQAVEHQIEEGIVIDGVRWATRNVDVAGRFVDAPESLGMLFRWNSRKAWDNTTDSRLIDNWGADNSTSEYWERANDPCPQGWRVPTEEELQSLYNSGSIWVTKNGVNGRLFGNVPNQVFLPAAGWRDYVVGWLNGVGESGVYWSSTMHNAENTLFFLRDNVSSSRGGYGYRSDALSVRCVAVD